MLSPSVVAFRCRPHRADYAPHRRPLTPRPTASPIGERPARIRRRPRPAWSRPQSGIAIDHTPANPDCTGLHKLEQVLPVPADCLDCRRCKLRLQSWSQAGFPCGRHWGCSRPVGRSRLLPNRPTSLPRWRRARSERLTESPYSRTSVSRPPCSASLTLQVSLHESSGSNNRQPRPSASCCPTTSIWMHRCSMRSASILWGCTRAGQPRRGLRPAGQGDSRASERTHRHVDASLRPRTEPHPVCLSTGCRRGFRGSRGALWKRVLPANERCTAGESNP